jgi:integrase
MLAQLDRLADDDRLDPESLPVVEWFRDEVKAAATGGRLDELAALLPQAGIRRRRWWHGRPALDSAGYLDDEDQADEDDADELPAAGVPVRAIAAPALDHAGIVRANGFYDLDPAGGHLIKTVRKNHGPSAAKTTKNVLSLLLGMAVRHGALGANPVREVAKISAGRKARPRALTVDDEAARLVKVAAEEQARELDVPDLVEFLDGTGMRVGEALGVRAEVVDLDAGVLEVNATVARLTGLGAVLQLRPKTEAGWRVIALPDRVVELCRRRMAMSWPRADREITVIGADGETSRQPAERFGWVTSHTFRRTVATRLDEAGLSARAIADHLGHAKPSMTQDTYMGRNVASAEAAKILDGIGS